MRGRHPRLIVIGAGPKALAIAAKHTVLARLGFDVPQLIVIDRSGVAADWVGSLGYTDGSPSLGTRPEKDVGFPYASTTWGALSSTVSQQMAAYSWQRHLIDTGAYAAWIDRGRPQPTHRTWSRYLRWVAEQVELQVVIEEIHAMRIERGRWHVACTHDHQGEQLLEGDGLVVTGPGTPISIAGQPHDHPRVLNGSDFWTRMRRLPCTKKHPVSVGVVGSGETAAGIVVALIDTLHPHSAIEIISSQGVPYTRGESYEESRLFSNPEPEWHNLTEHHRREFVRRTDRGVFSMQAQATIDRAENVRTLAGQATHMKAKDDHVLLGIRYGEETEWVAYDFVVIAIGFDTLSFTRWFDRETHERFAPVVGNWSRERVERSIGRDLAVDGCEPRLHLPMLAGVAQGPGFPNLSCLGLLSDRVLFPYTGMPHGASERKETWLAGGVR